MRHAPSLCILTLLVPTEEVPCISFAGMRC